jgi:hypothetical protein
MNPGQSIDPAKLASELSERGLTWADANAAAEALEETKGSVLAQLASEYIGKGESAAKAEMLAKADPAYTEHLEKMVSARRSANRAKVRFDVYKAYIELARSAESSRRSEMNLR